MMNKDGRNEAILRAYYNGTPSHEIAGQHGITAGHVNEICRKLHFDKMEASRKQCEVLERNHERFMNEMVNN